MTSLTTSISTCLDPTQKAKVIPSHRWVKVQIDRFKMPETKMRSNESVEARRSVCVASEKDRLHALKTYLRYTWSEVFRKKKSNDGGMFEWKDPFSRKTYTSNSLVFEIAMAAVALGFAYSNSALDAWGQQPAKNCSHALRRAAGLFRFLRTEFLVEHKIEDLDEMPVCITPSLLNACEKMCVAAAQQIALCVYREMRNLRKSTKSLVIFAKLCMGVTRCLEKASTSLSIVRNDVKDLESIRKNVISSSHIFEAISHGILAQDIASRKTHYGAAVAHMNRCVDILSNKDTFSTLHRDVVREFCAEFESSRKRLMEDNNKIYFSVVPDKVDRLEEIVLESAKPVHPMEYEQEETKDSERKEEKENQEEEEEEEKKDDERRISIIKKSDNICRIEIANVSWNCATITLHLAEELCKTFSNMDGVPVIQIAWKTASETDWHTEGRPLVVCNRGETQIQYTVDLLKPDSFYVFRVRAGEQDIDGDDVETVVKQCESVRSWTSWCKETGAVRSVRARSARNLNHFAFSCFNYV